VNRCTCASCGSFPFFRRFDRFSQREQLEEAFHGGDEWRDGRREAMPSLLENYADIVRAPDDAAVEG
jgi:hypothetical protein